MTLSRKQFLSGLAALGAGMSLLPDASRRALAADAPAGLAGTAGVTAETAAFVVATRYEDLPPELIALGKQHILDAFGLAIAGQKAETGPIVHRYLAELGVLNGLSTVLGTDQHAAPRFAAFANGVAIHADDFDDTQLAVAKDRVYGLLTHPTVPTLPPALALAEALNKSGRDFMLAYHLGVEVATKLAEAIAPRSYESGFHSTSMCGVFGSAAAAGKLRGLDARQLRNAFGVAGAEAGGLRENFGTMTKPFQAGHSAEAGIVAADLAALGWTAAEDILEAKRGFFAAFGGGWDPGAIVGRLGRPWSLLSPGVSIKPYPSGSLTHPAMDVMADLIAQHGIRPQEVAQVRVGTNRQMLNTLIHHRPRTGLQAKFSMEYCMAVLLVLGKAGLGQFQDDVVNRPELQAMIDRVTFYNNPDADAAGADKMRSYVELRLTDGRTVLGQGDFARGSPEKPMSFDDTVAKFEGCADFAGLPRDRVGRIVSAVRNLEAVPDMRAVCTGLFA
ncbi:MmgE/PrpD family protein [Methylobacterium sp. E-005]|uniref:MmgE/PrpD family protein n=1 Tax=Methylobacterium sp. E-005 TaxID=2836549 RepID=UPI001FB8E981|nr:MmgE/PrpD family protein [Methylobacterium sp. E-005]MCJ2087778.1 MmgE/PrpD family protein [Methylobacterium sp. E-005]